MWDTVGFVRSSAHVGPKAAAQSCEAREAPDSRTVSFRPASLIEFDNISPISDEARELHVGMVGGFLEVPQ